MNAKKIFFFFFLSLSVVCISCKENTSEPAKSNRTNGPNWTLEDVFSLAAENPNLFCLIVSKDDHIVKEQYFRSSDSLSPHDVRSVTKSVLATLVGIAIDRGIIPSEDQKIGDFIRPLVGTLDSSRSNITIRNVLTMSTGLAGNDIPNASEYLNWLNAPNQLEYTLQKNLNHQPGQMFGYNTGASHIASIVLTQSAGISTFQFAKQYLFTPLDIADHFWAQDKQGYFIGGAALSLTPYDMLKIGRLYMNKGMYNGVRVVSEEWIQKASTFKISTDNAQPFGPGYGYFWWIGTIDSHEMFFANGYGGQFIVVVPEIHLIVVAANAWENISTETANQQWRSTINLIMEKIIPLY